MESRTPQSIGIQTPTILGIVHIIACKLRTGPRTLRVHLSMAESSICGPYGVAVRVWVKVKVSVGPHGSAFGAQIG